MLCRFPNSRNLVASSALDKFGNELESYSGEFTTEGNTTTLIDDKLEEYNISASNGFVKCLESNYIIYNSIGQDVTLLNGSLNPGVYVVQVGDNRVKVMVK